MKEQVNSEFIAITQQQVCARLGVTLDALAEQMYQAGISFLQQYYKNATLMATLLEQDGLFWKWWRLEWHRRDIMFLEDDDVYAATQWRQVLVYQDFNDPDKLIHRLRAPRIVVLNANKTIRRQS